MRRIAVIALTSSTLLACGSNPPPEARPAPAPAAPPSASAVANVPPPEPALLPEPTGLRTVTPPSAVCVIGGDLSDGLELAGRMESAPLFRLSTSSARVTVGEGGAAYVDATTPSFSIHGLVARKPVLVRPARWIAFGGVYFPGTGDHVAITDARDGKVVLAAPAVPSFTFLGNSATAEAACGDVSLSIDASGHLKHEAPPPFQAHGATRAMNLKPATTIPIAPDADAAPTASFDASNDARAAVVLEQRGAKSHIRVGHASGWVATSMLVPLPKRTKPTAKAAPFEMTNLANLSAPGGAAPAPAASTAVTCAGAVRLIAEPSATPTDHIIIGTIPPGIPVRITEKGADLSYILLDEHVAARDARLAVPNRDLASCTNAPSSGATASATGLAPAVAPPDAIDALDLVAATGGSGSNDVPSGPTAAPRSGHPTALMRIGGVQVNGKMAPELVQRNMEAGRDRMRACYETALRANPTVSGRISTRFVIDEGGKVTTAESSSDLPAGVVTCIRTVLTTLRFPAPESGTVTVVYPVTFAPADEPAPPGKK